ncbi:peroxiredoxin [Paraburkholderia sp. BL6665CI2N2]|uniref:peroxiredoxin-like family protein n=1 Tax=Paraburkholderia sp. BL6665CI2N2 TaxID=1938806 RepID=UPI001065A087|nr:peroxiredoxin-like family protein [Paraburkholderia sp. BL6665CI2N2]TDY27083.1 peroxiredoxin [Paraburkholderia sp. BL6665CI2N2]
MKLQEQLDNFRAEFARTAPSGRAALYEARIEELRASFVLDHAVGVGDEAPDFSLLDVHDNRVSLSLLLQRGPVVVTFYRGGWCPYCNIQLRAYQAVLPEMATLGARLVAISPQLAHGSLTTVQTNALTFDVLSDVNNSVARRFGLAYALPADLREALRSSQKALPAINGDESWELPIPATYVIAPDGRVALASIEVDYRKRLEPDVILAALKELQPA